MKLFVTLLICAIYISIGSVKAVSPDPKCSSLLDNFKELEAIIKADPDLDKAVDKVLDDLRVNGAVPPSLCKNLRNVFEIFVKEIPQSVGKQEIENLANCLLGNECTDSCKKLNLVTLTKTLKDNCDGIDDGLLSLIAQLAAGQLTDFEAIKDKIIKVIVGNLTIKCAVPLFNLLVCLRTFSLT